MLKYNRIAVPGGFFCTNYIYTEDKPEWFTKAFTEDFLIHGLQQYGYYWVKEEDNGEQVI